MATAARRLRATPGILDAAVRLRRHIEFEPHILRLEQEWDQDKAESEGRIYIASLNAQGRTLPNGGLDE
jgi:hypothetical protein